MSLGRLILFVVMLVLICVFLVDYVLYNQNGNDTQEYLNQIEPLSSLGNPYVI
jgi:hypothetical protein